MTEPPAEQPEWPDADMDALALIEAWALIDYGPDGTGTSASEAAERQGGLSMAAILPNMNAYEVALAATKALASIRQAWLSCPEECCREQGAQNFRGWFLGAGGG